VTESVKITPTDEQLAVVDAAGRGAESLMVEAYAGSAKTTTLVLAGERIKVPALALAFNKSIAAELGKRFPSNFTVKTMNGLGFGALTRGLPQVTKWDIEPKKLGRLVTQIAKERKYEINEDQWDAVRRLVVAAQLAGILPGQSDGLVADSPEPWNALAEDCWISQGDLDDWAGELAYATLVKNNQMVLQGKISFDDQVYFPTVTGMKFPLFPVMLVDEAQDLSQLNHAMCRAAMRPGGRLIVVGDSRQAIYGFRGADGDSMRSMRGLKPEWQTLPLTMTFRCPRVVVGRQQQHAPGFRAWEGCQPGTFKRWVPADDGWDNDESPAEDGWDWAWVMRCAKYDRVTMAVLCRNNSPLMSLAFKLLRSGIGVVMTGRDIGKGLVALSRKIESDDRASPVTFATKLRDWQETEESLARANGHEEKLASITDRAECLRAVLDSAGVRDAGELRGALEKLFARDSGRVTLSTIHRAKGLEYDLVLHLDPWRIPSKQSKRMALAGDDRALRQEYNLKYVAETRTRNVLLEANLEDFVS
jgi:DNA helicase II / ATP-dependent DNA helicase PcrA